MYGHRWIVLATRLHGVEADTAVNRGAAKGGVYIGRGGALIDPPRWGIFFGVLRRGEAGY